MMADDPPESIAEARNLDSLTADFYWRCHICGEMRPDRFIRVFKTDISAEHGMPPGTITQNVRYCEDKAECVIKAQTHRLFKPKP